MERHTKDALEKRFEAYYAAHRQGNLTEAEHGYRELLKQKPQWGQVLTALGNLYLDQDRPDRAKPVFEKAANLNPPDLSACYNLGRLKQLENDHEGAIAIYKAMIDLQPEVGLVWNNLGVAYRETGKPDDAIASFREAVRLAPDMAAAWNNLGVAQDERNLGEAAVISYRKAIDLQPDYASPLLNLGISFQKSGQYKEADALYSRVLTLQPDNEIAAFMRQSIRGDEPPDAAPVDHVRSIFDQCADNFETILVEELEYKTPECLFSLVRPFLAEKMRILDLGCGTGLGAQLYRPYARELTGVDVSIKMLEKAGEKNLYDRLAVFDILQEWAFPEKFDLIYSSDVFVYLGNLDPVLKSAASYLVSGGKLAFSVEALGDASGDYKLYPSGRYAHSKTYIEDCLNRHEFNIAAMSNTDIRNQSGQPVKGLLIVAERL